MREVDTAEAVQAHAQHEGKKQTVGEIPEREVAGERDKPPQGALRQEAVLVPGRVLTGKDFDVLVRLPGEALRALIDREVVDIG